MTPRVDLKKMQEVDNEEYINRSPGTDSGVFPWSGKIYSIEKKAKVEQNIKETQLQFAQLFIIPFK